MPRQLRKDVFYSTFLIINLNKNDKQNACYAQVIAVDCPHFDLTFPCNGILLLKIS
jgi:hypothetical protein